MPCQDSSSGINLHLDYYDRLLDFKFGKITCSSEITGDTGYREFCRRRSIYDILEDDFQMLVSALNLNDNEEAQFILHLEWEALRAAICEYLGIDRPDVDVDRCQISSIEYNEEGVEVSEVILPPAELPKIESCSRLKEEHFAD